MDRKEKKSLVDEEEMEENKKFCVDCKTTKTPLWRSGPSGPKSLCNACGIRFRKKRKPIVGDLEKSSNREKKKERSNSTSSVDTTVTSTLGGGNGLSESLKEKLMVWGKEMMLQRSSIVKKQRCQRRRKLGEEEQAAFSLMAMSSCGSVLA